jgi:hypothetical protein
MDKVQKAAFTDFTHHRQNPLDFIYEVCVKIMRETE